MFRSLHRINAVLLLCATSLCAQSASSSNPPLRTVREIRALSQEQVLLHPAVALTGTITYSEPDWYLTFLTDETGGIYLGTDKKSRFTPGDQVEVTGVVAEGGTSAIVIGHDQIQPQIRVVGHGLLPPAKEAVPARLASGDYDAEWIALQGTVRSHTRVNDRARLDLDLGTSHFEVLICDFPDGRELPGYLEEVPVFAHGVLGTFSESHGVISRTVLYVPSVRQCEPDPAYLDAQYRKPVRRYSDLFRLTEANGGRRVHLQGQVHMAKLGRGFFMRVQEDDILTGSLWVQTTQPISLRPGQWVDVIGRVELANRKPVVRDAIARDIGWKPLPTPSTPKPEDVAAGDYHAMLVALDGILLEEQTGLEEDSLILLAGQTAVCARLDTGSGRPHLASFSRGSRLRISGACVLPSQQTLGAGSLPFSFQVWMRDPEDAVLLAAPPWWTMKRVIMALEVTAAIAVAAFFWLFALRRRVLSQTQMIREHVSRQTLQEERVRIAREFHDTFEQHLVGLGLTLQAAEAEIGDPDCVHKLLREAAEMTRHTRDEARHAIWELRTGALSASDIASLIKEELSSSAQAAHVDLQVEVQGRARPLPAVVQNHLLRIAQEGFTNALKHSAAEQVSIRLAFGLEEVSLLVVDDGAGFDTALAAQAESGRFGLAGMRERALRMEGNFDVDSSPGHGTRVQVRVPLPQPSS